MAADTIVESIRLKVESEKRKTRDGEKKVLIVKHNGKTWTVGKDSIDKVSEGCSYDFNLQKSEWKDKIYYWANLNESDKENSSDDQSITGDSKQVVAYFKTLSKEKQISMIQYLVGLLNG